MENEENKVIDDSVFRWQHTFNDGIVSAEEFAAWKDSLITKKLLEILNYYCITVTVEAPKAATIIMHVLGQFDIKKGILEKDKQARKDLNRYKDGQG